jgi:prepilin-type N-terminal cleavage/methylation domain-containing protein
LIPSSQSEVLTSLSLAGKQRFANKEQSFRPKKGPGPPKNIGEENFMLGKMRNVKGFTLIELMVVVAIIGIILAIAIPYFIAYKRTSCDRAASADITKLGACLERFGNELVDLNCPEYNPNATNIAFLVGPYYGWGGSNRKCEVRITVDNVSAPQEVMGCALNGSRPIGIQTRYLYRTRVSGGVDLPASQTSVCHSGSQYGGRGNSCYTESMIDSSCSVRTPGAIDCASLTNQ